MTTEIPPTDKPASKTDLIDNILSETNHPRAVVKEVVDALFASIPQLAKKHRYVAIRGFGRFEYRTMRARKARGGISNKPIEVGERDLLKFTVSKDSSTV